MEPNFFERVYRVVEQIPRGKVVSYGQVAGMLGHPRGARTVGWALNSLTQERARDVPWHRVINRSGLITISKAGLDPSIQRSLLEAEGVVFDAKGAVDMREFGWSGLDWHETEALWDAEPGE